MRLAVLKERRAAETRVAATPDTIKKLVGLGLTVAVESGAGASASISDAEFSAAGAEIAADAAAVLSGAGIVFAVQTPDAAERALIPRGALLVCIAGAFSDPDLVPSLAAAGIDTAAMELLPRITRAQSMDVLSSQANLAGYRAVIESANAFQRGFPMMMTAAGTVPPARVFIVGAGVAGLQAIATARRLGALVSAYDVRPAVKEQVQSLGAKFVELPLETASAQDAGGYARELSPEQQHKQRDLMARVVIESDVVIATAAIPGKPAPKLIPDDVVAKMQTGAVIVDLAAESGGNCQSTEPGKIIQKNGVTIVGLTNVAGTAPFHASQMYANNLVNLMKLILTADAGLNIDPADEIIAGILLCRGGQIVHPRLKELQHHA
jgi:H+-translocating NAD(P) transhydrogenase subunit alpha